MPWVRVAKWPASVRSSVQEKEGPPGIEGPYTASRSGTHSSVGGHDNLAKNRPRRPTGNKRNSIGASGTTRSHNLDATWIDTNLEKIHDGAKCVD